VALVARPVDQREANAFVLNFHRHNKPVVGARFSIGAEHDGELVGVAIVGRPTARKMQDGRTAEVTRCCVRDHAPKGCCSFLYAASWRAWRAMDTLQSEGGASLRGAGWKIVAELKPGSPNAWQSRPDREWQPIVGQAKFRWEQAA
jgi:hypothetical protein